jgi:hypothetical protein
MYGLLRVVQHEQAHAGGVLQGSLDRRPAPTAQHRQRALQRTDQRRLVTHVGQGRHAAAPLALPELPPGELHGQPRLADAAGADQRQQALRG